MEHFVVNLSLGSPGLRFFLLVLVLCSGGAMMSPLIFSNRNPLGPVGIACLKIFCRISGGSLGKRVNSVRGSCTVSMLDACSAVFWAVSSSSLSSKGCEDFDMLSRSVSVTFSGRVLSVAVKWRRLWQSSRVVLKEYASTQLRNKGVQVFVVVAVVERGRAIEEYRKPS